MRILDKDGNELDPDSLDYSKGTLKDEKIFVKHHDAQPYVEEVKEKKVLRTYPNGGKDIDWVIVTPGQEAKDAYDEYEDIQRWTPYTADELNEKIKANASDAMKDATNAQAALAVTFLIQQSTTLIDDNNAEAFSSLLPDFQNTLSYDAKSIVRFAGKLWRAIQKVPAGLGDPDKLEAYWNRIGKPDADGTYGWIQPYDTTDAYPSGDVVSWKGDKWKSNLDYNVWEPGVYGWTKETSEVTPPVEEDWPEWKQPGGAADAYAKGAKVSHNGKKWTSDVDANVWEPGVSQWTEYTGE